MPNVLVMEDDHLGAAALGAIAGAAGCEVKQVRFFSDLARELMEFNVHLIIMAGLLPDQFTFAAVRFVRSVVRARHVPLVLHTRAPVPVESDAQVRDLNILECLHTRMTIEEIRARVVRHLPHNVSLRAVAA